jgi:hypothetical protein
LGCGNLLNHNYSEAAPTHGEFLPLHDQSIANQRNLDPVRPLVIESRLTHKCFADHLNHLDISAAIIWQDARR